ncbi:hypothetical protein Syun_016770 [Stephania yunnanensis]|uniref:Yippee domain-containing protein n=1 Tax=Stephania yunnanensis TaxID=152371 RepID=A0AAP0P2G6_9MAGN
MPSLGSPRGVPNAVAPSEKALLHLEPVHVDPRGQRRRKEDERAKRGERTAEGGSKQLGEVRAMEHERDTDRSEEALRGGERGEAAGAPNVSTEEKGGPVKEEVVFLIWFSVNITVGEKEDRMRITGKHTVADIFCVGCGLIIGWKYCYAITSLGFQYCVVFEYESGSCELNMKGNAIERAQIVVDSDVMKIAINRVADQAKRRLATTSRAVEEDRYDILLYVLYAFV